MNIFNYEEQMALKGKIENFLGKEIDNFLGSPHMHIFADIITKLEEIGHSPKEQSTVVKVIDDAKKIDIDALKQAWNSGEPGIVTVAGDINAVVSDVENLKGELTNVDGLPNTTANAGEHTDGESNPGASATDTTTATDAGTTVPTTDGPDPNDTPAG